MEPRPSLLDMPEVVLNIIIGLGDFQTVFKLRRVCHDLRNYIDDSHPKINCISIGASFIPKKITLIINFPDREDEQITYRGAVGFDSTEIQEEKYVKGIDFVDAFFQNFSYILPHLPLLLPRFSLKFQYTNDKTDLFIPGVLKKFEATLGSRQNQLAVGSFIMNAYTEDQLLRVLPHLDPKHLKEIHVLNAEHWLGVHKLLEINEAAKLDQWKSAKQIVIRRHIPIEAVRYFGHTTVSFISFFVFSLDEFYMMKQVFLQSTSLQKLRFDYSSLVDILGFFDAFGQEHPVDSQSVWYYRIAGSDRIFKLVHSPLNTFFIFEKIRSEEVPVGTVLKTE